MVRRKPVPQPLSLPQHGASTVQRTTTATNSNAAAATTAASAPASSSTGSAPVPAAPPARATTGTGASSSYLSYSPGQSQSQSQSQSRSAGLGQPVSSASASLSPANTTSPPGSASTTTRTSPFSSRFAINRPQTAKAGHSSPPADFEPFTRRSPSQPHVDYYYRQSPKSSSPYPHIASAYSPSKASPPIPQTEAKTPKGAFFQFAKPSQSTDQFINYPHQPSASSRGDARPTEGDGPSAPRQAGTFVNHEGSSQTKHCHAAWQTLKGGPFIPLSRKPLLWQAHPPRAPLTLFLFLGETSGLT